MNSNSLVFAKYEKMFYFLLKKTWIFIITIDDIEQTQKIEQK